MQFLDAERVQYSGEGGEAVAEGEVHPGPVEQVGEAGLFPGGESAQRDGTPGFRVVRALTDQMIPLLVHI